MKVITVSILCILHLVGYTQPRKFTVIEDESRIPLTGVVAKDEGGKILAISDQEGRISFSESVKNNTLQLSLIGYVTSRVDLDELKAGDRVALYRDVQALEEVMVINTGYQELSKERVTGSFEFVDNKLFNRRAGTDVLSRLENTVPGMLFDRRGQSADQLSASESNIIVRGVGTLSDDIKSPLIVLDNFPYGGNIEDINPNDIESVTVLRDAAAASIWGARAGNGVIVLTSKKGRKARPMQVDVNSNLRLNGKPDLFKYERMGVKEYINMERDLFEKGFYNNTLSNRTRFPAITPVIELLDLNKRDLLSQEDLEEKLSSFAAKDFRQDYERYFYRTAKNYQNHVSLRGGSDKHQYLFSAGVDNNESVLVGNNTDRYSIRTNNNYQLLPSLKMELTSIYTQTKTTSNSPGDYTVLNYDVGKQMYPYAVLHNDDGTMASLVKTYRSSYIDTAGSGQLLDWTYNPLRELNSADNINEGNAININIGINYTLNRDLQFDLRYQYENIRNTASNIRSEDMFYTRDLINQFSFLNDGIVGHNLPRGSIIDKSNIHTKSHALRLQANYNKIFAHGGELHLLAGNEIRDAQSNGNVFRYMGVDKNTLGYSSVDNLTMFTKWDRLGRGRIPTFGSLTGTTDRFVSFYGNGSYTFKSKYTISGSTRNDASNLFGASANNKWKPLWSLGGKWNLAAESFMGFSWLNDLSLRITHGVSGNTNNTISAVPILSIQNASSSIINRPQAVIQTPGNEHLSWESVYMTNIGIDYRLFNNRFSGTIEGYSKISKNLITGMEVDPTTGMVAILANSGEMRGMGLDLSFTGRISQRIVSWESTFLLSYNDFKISHLNYDFSNTRGLNTALGNGSRITLNNNQNNPYGIYSFDWRGLDKEGNPVGLSEGMETTDYRSIINNTMIGNLAYHGSALPRYFGAWRNTIGWKNLAISFNISFKMGYYFKKAGLSYTSLYQNGIGSPDYGRRWQKEGDEAHTDIPSAVYPADSRRDQFFLASPANVLRADNIRFDDITLNYTLDNSALKSLPFENIKIFAHLNRLGLLWKATSQDLDPDFNVGNAFYPPARQITFGVNLSL